MKGATLLNPINPIGDFGNQDSWICSVDGLVQFKQLQFKQLLKQKSFRES